MARYDIYSGIISNGLILSSGTSMYISSGGVANSTTVNYIGYMYISSGGVANSTTVTPNGSMFISSGGTANSTTIDGGYMAISSGGTANNTTVNYMGYMYIFFGGVANSTTVNSGGYMFIYSGGVANSNTVNSSGYMRIYSGGTANSTTVNSQGSMFISSGGTATNIVAESGAELTITVASNTYIQGTYAGSAFEMKNAFISGYTVNSNGFMHICSGGVANSTTVNRWGYMLIDSGSIHRGSLQIASGAVVSAYSGSEIDFTIADRKASDGYLINDLSLIKGYPTYTITVSAEQEYGVYKLAQGADKFTGTVTIGDGSVDYGTITVNGADFVHNGVTYSLDQLEGDLTLTMSGGAVPSTAVADDLDGNGLADVILRHTKQGYSGAWLTTGDESIIKWGSLSNLKAGTEILGTGTLYGSENDGQDIFFADSKSVGAWNVVDGKVTGYKSIMSVNSTTNVLGLGDFNGDGATDILLRSTNGDLGFYGTDGTGWEYLIGLGKEWIVAAIGDLNGDGLDDVVLRHDAGFAGTFLTQTDGTVKWANLDTLSNDMTIVGTGDFNGDGVDNVLLQKDDGWVGAWLVEEGRVDSFIGLCNNKNTIEQIADFNGDGIDDLRIRTDKGDIGVLYVNDTDDTTWQYFKSVGTEWDTSFAALA